MAKSPYILYKVELDVRHHFGLTEDKRINCEGRCMVPKALSIVRDRVDNMLSAGVITTAHSLWSLPVVIAVKKDGHPRFSVNYSALNRRMK